MSVLFTSVPRKIFISRRHPEVLSLGILSFSCTGDSKEQGFEGESTVGLSKRQSDGRHSFERKVRSTAAVVV